MSVIKPRRKTAQYTRFYSLLFLVACVTGLEIEHSPTRHTSMGQPHTLTCTGALRNDTVWQRFHDSETTNLANFSSCVPQPGLTGNYNMTCSTSRFALLIMEVDESMADSIWQCRTGKYVITNATFGVFGIKQSPARMAVAGLTYELSCVGRLSPSTSWRRITGGSVTTIAEFQNCAQNSSLGREYNTSCIFGETSSRFSLVIINVDRSMQDSIWQCNSDIVMNATFNVYAIEHSPIRNGVEGFAHTMTCTGRLSITTTWRRITGASVIVIAEFYRCNLNPILRGNYSVNCFKDSEGSRFNLLIKHVDRSMETSTWQCISGITIPAVFDVYDLVQSVEVVSAPELLFEDRSYVFNCTSSASRPTACIRWYHQLDNDSVDITENSSSVICSPDASTRRSSSSILTYKMNYSDDGSRIYCTGQNIANSRTIVSNVVAIKVYYKPRTALILTGYISGTPVNENSSITLTCRVGRSEPGAEVSWTGVCGDYGKQVREAGGSVSRTTTVQLTRDHNNESCTCRAIQSYTNWSHNQSVQFTVAYPPEVVITGETVMNQGQPLLLRCGALGMPNRFIFYNWTHSYGGKLIRTLPALSSLELPNVRFEDQGAYMCIVSNTIGRPRNKSIDVIVEGLPRFAEQPNMMTAALGENLVVSVGFVSFPEASRVVWLKQQNNTFIQSIATRTANLLFTFYGEEVIIPGHETLFLLKDINLTSYDNYTAMVTNAFGTESYTVEVRAQDAPKVVITGETVVNHGQPLQLRCGAVGLPNQFIFYNWTHSYGGKLLRTFPAIESVKLPAIRFEDQGDYMCIVSNTIGTAWNKSVDVEVEGLPRFAEQPNMMTAAVGENLVVSVGFVSFPEASQVVWLKQRNNTSLQSLTTRTKNLWFTFYGEEVIIPGHEAIFLLEDINLTSYDNYTAMVTNTFGTESYTVEVRAHDTPCQPAHLLSSCADIVMLSWKSCTGGGLEQQFILEYRAAGTNWEQSAEIIEDKGDGKDNSVELTNLRPDTEYIFRVHGISSKGASGYVETYCKTAGTKVRAGLSVGIYTGLAAGALLFIIVVVIIGVAWFRCKRRQTLSKSTNGTTVPDDHSTTQHYENSTFPADHDVTEYETIDANSTECARVSTHSYYEISRFNGGDVPAGSPSGNTVNQSENKDTYYLKLSKDSEVHPDDELYSQLNTRDVAR